MARRKKDEDLKDLKDINADDIIHIRLFMAEKFRKTLKEVYEFDPENVECDKLRKKISDLENIDNALDAYNDIKGNLDKLVKVKKTKTEKIQKNND